MTRMVPSAFLCLLLALGVVGQALVGRIEAQCLDYGSYARVVTRTEFEDGYSIALHGDYAYVPCGYDGLRVLDVSDPLNPQDLGIPNPALAVWAIDIDGDLAIVEGRSRSLYVLDLENPTEPHVVGSVTIPWWTKWGFDFVNGFCYGACGYGGMFVVDARIPTSPVLVGLFGTEDYAQDVWIHHGATAANESGRREQNLAFVAVWHAGLQIFDLDDPSTPTSIGHVDTGRSNLVAYHEGYVYVTNGESAGGPDIQIVDVSDPTTPEIVGAFSSLNGASPWRIEGSRLYCCTSRGVRMFDISTPTDPTPLGLVSFGRVEDVAIRGEHALAVVRGSFSAPGRGLSVLDVSNALSPPVVEHAQALSGRDVDIAGDYAYYARSDSGLAIVDVADPNSVSLVGTTDTPGQAYQLAVAGSVAYVADREAGLTLVNVSTPHQPAVLASVPPPHSENWTTTVAVKTPYAFAGGNWNGLQIIDVSDPQSPIVAAEYADEVSLVQDIVIRDDIAFIADWSRGLVILDVSVPTAPLQIAQVGGPASVLEVVGNTVYIQQDSYGVVAIDITDLASPSIIGRIDLPMHVTSIAGFGEWVFVGNEDYGIQIVDASDRSDLRVYGQVDTGGRDVEGLEIANNLAFGVTQFSGTYILALQCEPTPVLAAGFTGQVLDRSVKLSWFASPQSGMGPFHVYRSLSLGAHYDRLTGDAIGDTGTLSYRDLSPPPQSTIYYRLGIFGPSGVEVFSDPVAVSTPVWSDRLSSLVGPSPSPFMRSTTVRFIVSREGSANLSIYDVAGRLVRTLVDGPAPRGEQEVIWNGRDSDGRSVAGGVYFVRLSTEEDVLTQKVVCLRQ